MKLSDFSVEKPIAISMLVGIVILGGIVAFQGLGLELMPEMESPVLALSTKYPGASPQDIEDIITVPLESILSLTKNVKHVYSTSKESLSSIIVEFEWGTNLDTAAEDIRSSMSILKAFFPEEVEDTVIIKQNISMMPVSMYSVSGTGNLIKLRDFIDDNIIPKIERIEGVGGAFAMGGMEREIGIYIESSKIGAYRISMDHIVNILRGQNLNVTTGRLIKQNTEYIVRIAGEYKNLMIRGPQLLSVSVRTKTSRRSCSRNGTGKVIVPSTGAQPRRPGLLRQPLRAHRRKRHRMRSKPG